MFQQTLKVTSGFFGVEHLKAIVELMAVDSIPLLVDDTVKTGVVGIYVILPHVDLIFEIKNQSIVLLFFHPLECFPLPRKKNS